ncbi:unnamed protein product, partial [marine sediment metagenome]
RYYELDGKRHGHPPLGYAGRQLSAEYHCIHGNPKHIKANIQCVRSIAPEITGIVFAPVAASLAMLDQEFMKAGALVIDMGAGTTDYVLYSNGSIAASGCVPLGGNDITHEIHRATGISTELAEQLKIKTGNAYGIPGLDIEVARVINSETLSSTKVRRKLINRIIRFTLQNILSRIQQDLSADILDRPEIQLYLTGGGCQQKGVRNLVGDTFGIPVNYLGPENCPRCGGKFWKPQHSTVIGLLHYAHLMENGS